MAMIHRMKVLLGVLQELGGVFSDARMQQLLFLYCVEGVKRDDYYEFIPLNGSPYSLQAAEDKRVLMGKNILAASDDWALQPTTKRYAVDLDFFEKIAIQDIKNQWAGKPDEALAAHIAAHHPYYSQPPAPHPDDSPTLYTIGYEGISPEAYINALINNHVRMLCDVRRNSISKKYGFSKSDLAGVLPRVGIEYRHIPELGIVSEKRKSLETDRDYEALFAEYEQTTLPRQQDKLDLLMRLLAEKRRIAITCFEADPWHCHRSRVAGALKARNDFTPYHIQHWQSCHAHANPISLRFRKSL